MGKPSRSKRTMNFGKGKVTPIQVAFIVDRYLCDNRFSETRSVFRSEASSLFSNSSVREVPKGLLPLDEMLNEYVWLKAQKVMLDQDKMRLEQEKTRVHNLLQGMQDVMIAFNASAAAPPPEIPAAEIPVVTPAVSQTAAVTPQQNNFRGSPSGCTVYNTPNAMPVSLPGNKRVECGNFSTPSTSQSITRKRKGPETSAGAPPVSRKTWNNAAIENSATYRLGVDNLPRADRAVSCSTSQIPSEIQTLANSRPANESYGQGSSVAKCLFNKAVVSSPITSTCPRTPQKQASPQSDKSITPQDFTPTNCTIVTKERITVSPLKQIASYTVERSHLISSSPAKSNLKRDHVKGRLNFDESDTAMCSDTLITADGVSTSPSGSEQETDFFDMDFPNLDLLGENFSFSELLVDLDLACEGAMDPCLPQPSSFPAEAVSGSSPESGSENLDPDPVVSEYTSNVTEVIQGKDMNTQGPESMTAVKSVTKCIRILSPVKKAKQRVTAETTD